MSIVVLFPGASGAASSTYIIVSSTRVASFFLRAAEAARPRRAATASLTPG